jgi:hypothetical protein
LIKDSETRQRKAIESFAKSAGYIIVDWFYDAAVSGADPIEARAGFTAALARIAGNGVRTIVRAPDKLEPIAGLLSGLEQGQFAITAKRASSESAAAGEAAMQRKTDFAALENPDAQRRNDGIHDVVMIGLRLE